MSIKNLLLPRPYMRNSLLFSYTCRYWITLCNTYRKLTRVNLEN